MGLCDFAPAVRWVIIISKMLIEKIDKAILNKIIHCNIVEGIFMMITQKKLVVIICLRIAMLAKFL